MAEVLGQMANLTKSIEALTASVSKTNEKVDAQGKKIAETADLAKSAKDAVSKTVRGHADADPAPDTVRKGDGAYTEPPLIDTAFNRPN